MEPVEQGLLVGLDDDDVRHLLPAVGRLPVLRGFVGRDSKHLRISFLILLAFCSSSYASRF